MSTFIANVCSILEYGSVVLSGMVQSHINRIERVQDFFWSGCVPVAVYNWGTFFVQRLG